MNKDNLVYKDEDYEIYKKNASDSCMMQQFDILDIGIEGIADIKHHFKFEEDYRGIVDKAIAKLEALK